jgi:hypothetical protein
MLHCVALVRTNVSEECSASIIGVTRTGEVVKTLAITSNWHMLWRNTMYTVFLGTSAVTSNRRTLQRNATYTVFLHSMCRLLVTANVVPSSPNLVTLLMEVLHLVLTRATRHIIPDDGILHSHHRENLKSYTVSLVIIWKCIRQLKIFLQFNCWKINRRHINNPSFSIMTEFFM